MKIILSLLLILSLSSCKFDFFKEKHLDEDGNEIPELEPKIAPFSEIGRYQVIDSSPTAFLVDTKTGRVWRHVIAKQYPGSPWVWQEDYIIDEEYPPTYRYDDMTEQLEEFKPHRIGYDRFNQMYAPPRKKK